MWRGEREVAVTQVAAPSPPPGWALVQMSYAGLCGTDLHICAGEHPRAKPGLVIGHEFVGRLVDAAGEIAAGTPVFVNPLLPCRECHACHDGRPNACERLEFLGIDRDGGAAEYAAVPCVNLVALPSSLDLELAAVVEPLAVAVHAVRRGAVEAGRQVHVVGGGPIGVLVACCARLQGGSVTVSEPASGRAAVASELGFELISGPGADRRADVVFDCTGYPSVSPTILQWAATGGVVVTVGAYPGVVGVDLQELMFRELTMIGARAYTPAEVVVAVGLIARGAIDPVGLITEVLPLEAGPAAIEVLRSGRAVKVLLAGQAA
jgi:(R,R)-butanediol dehydrogenase / meso-butanediol dehydrogenase / diacetyl reductase